MHSVPAETRPTRLPRVRVGKFGTRREAETIAAKLQKEEQFKPWITRDLATCVAESVVTRRVHALSTTLGAFASWRSAGAQFSEIRSSLCRVDRTDATVGGAGRACHDDRAGRCATHAFLLSSRRAPYFAGTRYAGSPRHTTYGGMHTLVLSRSMRRSWPILPCFLRSFAGRPMNAILAHGAVALMAAPLVWVATEFGRSCCSRASRGSCSSTPGDWSCRSLSWQACSASYGSLDAGGGGQRGAGRRGAPPGAAVGATDRRVDGGPVPDRWLSSLGVVVGVATYAEPRAWP